MQAQHEASARVFLSGAGGRRRGHGWIRAGLLRLEGELAEKIKWRDAVQAEINRRQRDIDRHKPKSNIVIRRKQPTMTP